MPKPPKSQPAQKTQSKLNRTSAAANTKLDLSSFESFRDHPLVIPSIQRYHRDVILADAAVKVLVTDLENLNEEHEKSFGRVAFITIEGRVKTEDSFLKKLYIETRESSKSRGITAATLSTLYAGIRDLAGVRFSCPYFDQVTNAITSFVRPRLSELGHATDLRPRIKDKDYLDRGDERGYRSYHFFVNVSTPTDIFGNRELCLCEVQARSELQHVWAVKSHDLLYKMGAGWYFSDKDVVEDMRQVSNSLRAADQSLISIRDRIVKVRDASAVSKPKS